MSRRIALLALNNFSINRKFDDQWIKILVETSLEKSADRRLAIELINGTIKNLSLLDYVIDKFVKKTPENETRNIIRLSAYQILFLSRIPDYAVVNEAVNLCDGLNNKHQKKFMNAVLRNIIRNREDLLTEINSDTFPLELRYSIPAWLNKRLMHNYGQEQIKDLYRVISLPPLLTIRIREKKISISTFLEKLDIFDIAYELINKGPWCRIIDKEKFWQTDLVEDKLCYVQDYSSGIAARLFDFSGGKNAKILDMCSAPGGKTLQLLDRIIPKKDLLVSNDSNSDRLNTLRENLDDEELSLIDIRNEDGRDINGSFTHILIDAPCSGLGNMRKNADLKWNKSIDQINRLQTSQLELLEHAFRILEPGGELVYTTCSIDPIENIEVINLFLNKYPEMNIVDIPNVELEKFKSNDKSYTIFPQDSHEGAFAVKLYKSGS